ncbi:MAG: cation transporter [Burkholderiales bacterium]|nr:cation transporter [Burkholderiales bacterium]
MTTPQPASNHDHDEASHDHAGDHQAGRHYHHHKQVVTRTNARRISLVFFLTAGYALIQAIGGWLSGSLALIADSGHMVSDAAALLLALIAYRIAERPADGTRTYGFHRVRVLAALANGVALLLLVIWVIREAIERMHAPSQILAGPMLVVAVIGLVVNVAGACILWSGSKGDSNLRGALLHVLGDLLGSVAAIAAAAGILLTGWVVLDPLLSIFVALLIVRSAWGLVRDAIQVLLQAVPRGLDALAVEMGLAQLSEIAEAGHFHAWTLADDSIIATVHVSPAYGVDPLALPPLVSSWLHEHYAIDHVTVQVDPPGQLDREHR